MKIFSRYLIRCVFVGFAAAAGLLLPLFSTFNLINELEDVSTGGYRWSQALMEVLMTLPRTLIDLGPFIALLGGIVGLGQLSKSLELTAIRSAGLSIFRIAMIVLCSGIILTLSLGALDEWVASPLQQKALQLKRAAIFRSGQTDTSAHALWARKDDEYVTVRALDEYQQPVGIEIFHYNPDLSLEFYVYAEKATIQNKRMWLLHHVNRKNWKNSEEMTQMEENMQWSPIFDGMSLTELTMPTESFSITQLKRYISYLKYTGQPSEEFRIALWQKLGRPILILAMILLAVPFTFSNSRSPGMGSRLAIAVIVGLLTYISYQITLNLGLLLSISAMLTALSLPLLCLIIAIGLVYRFDQLH
ncbi:LPS export ABC transporter permease LptG [Pantoea piersonii]|uniref:LPS export ABC transporter permease LptG n=1 Tax=Pantoea piersonii TaxID=2364647 RepID=UPI00289D1620|nr:LPS export ABC transporter permease LptG [Pantoea piersonii]